MKSYIKIKIKHYKTIKQNSKSVSKSDTNDDCVVKNNTNKIFELCEMKKMSHFEGRNMSLFYKKSLDNFK